MVAGQCSLGQFLNVVNKFMAWLCSSGSREACSCICWAWRAKTTQSKRRKGIPPHNLRPRCPYVGAELLCPRLPIPCIALEPRSALSSTEASYCSDTGAPPTQFPENSEPTFKRLTQQELQQEALEIRRSKCCDSHSSSCRTDRRTHSSSESSFVGSFSGPPNAD